MGAERTGMEELRAVSRVGIARFARRASLRSAYFGHTVERLAFVIASEARVHVAVGTVAVVVGDTPSAGGLVRWAKSARRGRSPVIAGGATQLVGAAALHGHFGAFFKAHRNSGILASLIT